jgi:hypothetical protein
VKKQIFILVVFLFAISNGVFAQVIPITPYGIPVSADYTVQVNGSEVFTGAAGNYSFCTFDFDETVTVRVTFVRKINQIKIMPTSLGINHTTINTRTIEFTLDTPEMVTVQINGDLSEVLHLFTSYPETNIPNPGDPDVIYYAGPNEYDIGVLQLQDNQTLYIEAGAKLNGMVFANGATNVKIRGRGMIDGTDLNTSGNYPAGEEPWRLIYMVNSQNIEIEGITLYNSKHWTLHLHQCTNLNMDNIRVLNFRNGSDGTDLSSCQDVVITNSFYQTGDDGIVIKALSFADNAFYPNPMINNMDVKNIRVEGCTMLNYNWGSPFEIGYELRCDRVSDITYTDCDIIMAGQRGAALSIHNTDPAIVENVLYEDIRIENANEGGIGSQLFNLAIFYSLFSYDSYWCCQYNDHWDNMLSPAPPNQGVTQWRGQIKNITYRDIEVLDDNFPYSIFYGWDSVKKIEGVLLDNVIVNGQAITSAEALQLEFNNYAENIQFFLGDINNDNKVNVADFALFGSQWLSTACGVCGGADLTGDGNVMIDDARILAENWLNLTMIPGNQAPYPQGIAHAIPGRLEFEDYDYGGQDIAYVDTTPQNAYSNYRFNDVEILSSEDTDGGFAVYAVASEWLEYTCDILPGTYTMTVRSSSSQAAQTLTLSLDDQTLATFSLPTTGGFNNWQDTTISGITIPDGPDRTLRFMLDASTAMLNYVDFVQE